MMEFSDDGPGEEGEFDVEEGEFDVDPQAGPILDAYIPIDRGTVTEQSSAPRTQKRTAGIPPLEKKSALLFPTSQQIKNIIFEGR